MAIPLDQKEIVTTQELTIFNMLELEALRQLLFEKGVISAEDRINCIEFLISW